MAAAPVAIVLAAILALTLLPSGGGWPSPCSGVWSAASEGWRTSILNVVLFLPLGVVLALSDRRLERACLVGALLSAGIEFAQLFIPGRDSSIGDVLTNTTGSALGYMLARYAPRLRNLSRGATIVLALCVASAAPLAVATTGFLLRAIASEIDLLGAVDPKPRPFGVVSRSRAQRDTGPVSAAAAAACKLGHRAKPAAHWSHVARAGHRRTASASTRAVAQRVRRTNSER